MKRGSRRSYEPRLPMVAIFALVVCGGAVGASSNGLRVVCNPVSGSVTVVADAEVGLRVSLSDLLPGSRTAEVWIEENCPSRQCNRNGVCAPSSPPIDRNGWYVLCGTNSGDVGVVRGAVPSGFTAMAGPFADQDGADGWIGADCPVRRCEPSGECAVSAGPATVAIGARQAADPVALHSQPAGPRPPAGVPHRGEVLEVRPGSPADQAGFQVGDRMRKLNGIRISNQSELVDSYTAVLPGTWLIFDIIRNREHRSIGMARSGGPLGLRIAGAVAASTSSTSGWSAGEVSTHSRPSSPGGSGGWTVSEVLTANDTAGTAHVGGAVGPQRARTDLTPLVDAARASVAACAYQTALANADQLARFAPTSPWLEANHERLRQLAQRQRLTEQAIWRAGGLLNQGKLKDARKAVYDAAGSAVACQDEAVSVLLHRIDEVIAHNRARKQARNARLAGELLAGLFVVNQAVIGHQNGASINPGAATAPVIGVIDGASGGSGDPCQFNYSYPAGAMSVEPICGCGGYHYDAIKLRCVK